MNSAIATAFEKAAKENRSAFIPFLTAGFPDAASSLELLYVLEDNGADVIELGLPFSDPMADGPVIQNASHQALENGMTPAGVLALAAEAKKRINRPLVVMSYWNPILKMGPRTFASRAKDAGISGVILPDLPPEEAAPWLDAAAPHGLDTIFMVAPTTPPARRAMIMSVSSGFLYYVSLTGVTGSDFKVSNELVEEIKSLRGMGDLPAAVGFGVSGPEQARALAGAADGIIVGSALIRRIMAHDNLADQAGDLADFCSTIGRALHRETL
ncbi:MAG: tryptophan synthase subunit alpha [Pseudomonadota bacterium]